MEKIKYSLVVLFLMFLLFLPYKSLYADEIATPSQDGLGFLIMFIILAIIALLGVVAWLIIRSVRKKNKSN
jgi:hypothetical protein